MRAFQELHIDFCVVATCLETPGATLGAGAQGIMRWAV